MGMEAHLASMVSQTQAALRGIAQSLPAPAGSYRAELLFTPLLDYGDAMRLGIDTPAPVRQWLATVNNDALSQALDAVSSAAWHHMATMTHDDVQFIDRARSVMLAVIRICRAREEDPFVVVPPFADLRVRVQLFEDRRNELPRAEVERLLGVRVCIDPVECDKRDMAIGETEHLADLMMDCFIDCRAEALTPARVDRIAENGDIREHLSADHARTLCGLELETLRTQTPAGNAPCRRCLALARATDTKLRVPAGTGRGGPGTVPCGHCDPCRQHAPYDCWNPTPAT